MIADNIRHGISKSGDWARCTREMHSHPNSEEWQYDIDGRARMGVFVSEGNARTFNYQAGMWAQFRSLMDTMLKI